LPFDLATTSAWQRAYTRVQGDRLCWFCFLRHAGTIGQARPAALPSWRSEPQSLHRVGRGGRGRGRAL